MLVGGGSVTIVQYRSGLVWPAIGVVSVMAHSRYSMWAESRRPLDVRAVPLVIPALTCHL